MFWKKTCKKCGKKIDNSFLYCPYCGHSSIKENEERDYGFLGKNDEFDFFDRDAEMKLPFGFNFLFKNLIKEVDKQFKLLDGQIGRETKIIPRIKKTKNIKFPLSQSGGISINISGGAGKPIIRVKSFGNVPEFRELEEEIRPREKTEKARKTAEISEEKARQLAKLPRQEAESKVRRLSGKVIYEIELPGVKSLRDVIVNELENSIEIKAFAEDKAYFKFLPVALPLLKYKLLKEKLVLELGEE